MIKRIYKSLAATCLLFSGVGIFLLVGIVFRLVGETLGYNGQESILALVIFVFAVSYVFIGRLEK